MNSILVVAGSCVSAMVYLPTGASHLTVGGMGPGKSINLKRLGFDARLYTLVGNDQPGTRIRQRLEQQGVPTFYEIDPAGTNTHVNIMTSDGNRTPVRIILPSQSPDLDLSHAELLIANADLVALNVNNFCRSLIPAIRRHHTTVWCDLGDYEPSNPYFDDFVTVSTHVTLSGINLSDPVPVLESLIAAGKQLAVVTNGAEGSVAMTASGEVLRTPALRSYPVVDTNGAGDSFFSGLLFGQLRGFSLRDSLRIATTVAGLTVTSRELYHPDLSPDLVFSEVARNYADTDSDAPDGAPAGRRSPHPDGSGGKPSEAGAGGIPTGL